MTLVTISEWIIYSKSCKTKKMAIASLTAQSDVVKLLLQERYEPSNSSFIILFNTRLKQLSDYQNSWQLLFQSAVQLIDADVKKKKRNQKQHNTPDDLVYPDLSWFMETDITLEYFFFLWFLIDALSITGQNQFSLFFQKQPIVCGWYL